MPVSRAETHGGVTPRKEIVEPVRRVLRWMLSHADEQGRIICPDHRIAPDAKFELGDVYLQLGRYSDSADQFRSLIEAHPDSKYIAQAWFNFNPRFYIVALVFLIFDVEVAFTYPVATAFRRWVDDGLGFFAFFEIFLFVAILAVGLAYVWVKGDLEWIRRSKDDAEWRQMPTRIADDGTAAGGK